MEEAKKNDADGDDPGRGLARARAGKVDALDIMPMRFHGRSLQTSQEHSQTLRLIGFR